MAVQHSIWKIGSQPTPLKRSKLASESILEEQIFNDFSILDENWLPIGRQVHTDHGTFIDLLAIDASGALIIIELKNERTPREVVAQALDYASWAESLTPEKIASIYNDFAAKYHITEATLDTAFSRKFGFNITNEEINNDHQIVVVAAELDPSTERIINYLSDKGDIAINALFFSVFEDGDNQYLSRAWMIDPVETEERTNKRVQSSKWNGEYYASFGAESGSRSWSDAVKHGFISGGGGVWYSRTLFMLKPGDRVWVNIPRTGYVGVGEVQEGAIIADEFINPSMNLQGTYRMASEYGEEDCEYFVPVKWLHTVDKAQAVNEIGLFGNQNTVARPKAEKWTHTVERLTSLWQIEK